MFTADRGKLGELIAPRWLTALAALTALTVIVLNIKLLVDFVAG
jgi:manganese transport protein